MSELIQTYEEAKLYSRLKDYYSKIYPGVEIKDEEKVLTPKEIGDLYYTFPGIEEEATFNEKVDRIKRAIKYGYDTPLILARRDDKLILIDGHRRAVAAWELGQSWKALIMVFPENLELGIEKMIKGKVEDLFGNK